MNPYAPKSHFKKMQLLMVVFLVSILGFIERIGFITVSSVQQFGRVFLYLIVISTLLKGFLVNSVSGAFYNLPYVLNPDTQGVLGAAVVKEKYPLLLNEINFPNLSAVSIYSEDIESGTVLININSDTKLAPASTTKLMTAFVALDIYDLNEYVLIPEFCTQIEGQKSGFFANDAYKVRDLIYSLLVNSGADAACTLSLGKVSYTEFLSLMNAKAKKFGMWNSNFTNPIGLDAENGENYSTAKDLFKLAKKATENDLISEIVKTKETTLVGSEGFELHLYNTNELLWTLLGTVGIKTGKTEAAGEVLIYEYEDASKDIVIVLMGSNSRFYETEQALNWILSSYTWGDM